MSDDEVMPRWPDMDESKRCVATSHCTGQRCQRARVPGATVCATHGGSVGRVKAAARRRLEEQNARELAKRTVTGLDLSKYADPIGALEFSIGYSHALAVRLAGLVESIPDDQLAYRTKSGEHLRGELTAAQKALADLRSASEAALKIGLDARRISITEQTADMLDKALDASLTACGIGWDGRAKARQVLREHLKIAMARDDEPA